MNIFKKILLSEPQNCQKGQVLASAVMPRKSDFDQKMSLTAQGKRRIDQARRKWEAHRRNCRQCG